MQSNVICRIITTILLISLPGIAAIAPVHWPTDIPGAVTITFSGA